MPPPHRGLPIQKCDKFTGGHFHPLVASHGNVPESRAFNQGVIGVAFGQVVRRGLVGRVEHDNQLAADPCGRCVCNRPPYAPEGSVQQSTLMVRVDNYCDVYWGPGRLHVRTVQQPSALSRCASMR